MRVLTRGALVAGAIFALAGAANAGVDPGLFKQDIAKDVSMFKEHSRPIPCVPEPQTYAMLLLGLLSVGWMVRCRLTD